MTIERRDDGFEEELRGALRSAPWMGVSALVHGLVLLILSQFEFAKNEVEPEQALLVAMSPPDLELLEEPPEPPPPLPPEKEREQMVEEPVVAPIEPLELSSTDDDDLLAPVAAAFEARGSNVVIGVGGGASGRPGGPGGPGGRGPAKAGGRVVQSIAHGLEWLEQHQDPGGFWDSDGFSSQCERNLCDGKGGALHDVGVTGLATLAFLGAGHTTDTGAYREVVRSALRWLVSVQDPDDGCFGAKSGQHFLYGHALAALAMVEAFKLSGNPLLERPAQRALDFIARCRNPYAAWRYACPPDGDNDVSVSGWMLFALFAGRDAGLAVDDGAIEQGLAWIRSMTDPATGRTGYHERGSLPAREPAAIDRWPAHHSESMTACALLLDIFDGADEAGADVARRSGLLLAKLPAWNEAAGTIDFYYWYYGTYAMWQLGGRAWDSWQRSLLDTVVTHQRESGDELGSWDPHVDPWGRDGGRVCSTALNTLTLEVYYRYDRLFGTR